MNPKDCYLSRKDSGLQGGDIQVVKPCKCGRRGPAASQMSEMDTPLDHAQDHRTKVGLPSHSTLPKPLLEASVMTTFLLCAVSRIMPCFSQKGSLQRARADTQPESPLRGGVRDARPWMEPSASARTGWVACEADPTEVPAKPLP